VILRLFQFFLQYHNLFCLNKKGLNDSGSQNTPLATKLIAKFLALPKKLLFLLPKTA